MVDEAIDATAAHFNLRDAIEDFRLKAEEAKDPSEKHSMIERGKCLQNCWTISNVALGIYHLRRYYHLLVFQAYLNDWRPDDENPYSFESFVKHRPGQLNIANSLS